MHDTVLESLGVGGPQARKIGIIAALLGFIVLLWSTFVIVPAGSRGVVLWWGRVEQRIMYEGLNFKVPLAETVIKVDVRVQPHPFREIDASSKEYQIVKMTGMMNFHIDPAFVNDLYQKVGLDFADKVIDPAFNDFVKEVVPTYPIGEILPKREEIRQTAMKKLGNNLSRDHIIVDDIYFANMRFSPEYEKAIEAKQVAQQQVETQKQILAQREIEAQQKVATAKGEAESLLVVATEQAEANEVLAHSLTPILVSSKSIERWNGMLPQVSGGALPFIDLGKLSRAAESTETDKRQCVGCRGLDRKGRRMSKPILDLSQHADEAFYAFVGRVSLLLVEQNVDAITATMFLRELAEAGGSMLPKDEAMVLAQNYVAYRPDTPRGKSLREPSGI